MKLGFTRSLTRLLKTQRKAAHLLEKAWSPVRRKPSRPERPTLQTITAFGSNPARLVMKTYVPSTLPNKPALVVVLHGCRQTPESMDGASGFSKLAKDRGFVLLYPEQTHSNNPQRCFNWFRPSEVARDRGELLSIKQMIDHALKRHRADRARVYIVGLSAGGAMTGALVANYPDMFAGAAIVAGMPVGAVRDAMSALRAMKSGASPPAAGWGARIHEISPDRRAWPPISIWQGIADRTVNPANALACVDQWVEASGLERGASRAEKKAWGQLSTWGAGGRQVSLYSIDGMGHGLPVKESSSARSRSTDPFVLGAGISAPAELMRLWHLVRR
ncbi:polyhydroxybutyrate depolymerase [Rhizobium sp. Root708]|uniref:extracellular catalytic domain type 1 short-chain-length polyhydroxyalkanoate depolymerase n=1 Tax=Rhizobium sp. Root708 TaxID=1736592 RepID=UPI0006FDF9A1|nr:PHB depolymerase family esterase [Rhizobium sp. Root708]KRB61531.1 polyhydroxybutyrate depolymerase [Rhizobium sp. Root708]